MTDTNRPRVVALVCEGIPQSYLLARLAEEFTLVGAVVYAPQGTKGTLWQRTSRYFNPVKLLRYLTARAVAAGYDAKVRPWTKRLFFIGGQAPRLPPTVPTVRVGNINASEAVEFVRTSSPDIVCVNGTNLLRAPMLELIGAIPYGVINLHTGLSPYSRGGNCNLFMLLEGRPEMVGITVHHIDKGIDSGDIVITARPLLEAGDSLEIIDAKCFRLGIDLLLVAVRQIVERRAERVKQWTEGKLFLKRTGYSYEPYHRVLVNRRLAAGLIEDYLKNRAVRDRDIRLVGRTD